MRKPITKEAKKTAMLLLMNTMLALLIYFGCIALGFSAIFFVFITLAAVLLLVYVIYNQGFVLRGATPEMLDESLPVEERQAMIDKAAARYSSSRWMMTVIIPLIVAVLADAIYIYFLADLIRLIGDVL
jgi:divalent metal cation (Fe/Co/Zn/Cd) transporter